MKTKRLTPIKAIRQNCLQCGGGSPKEARYCPILTCPLYPYRLGKNPNRKGKKFGVFAGKPPLHTEFSGGKEDPQGKCCSKEDEQENGGLEEEKIQKKGGD